MAANVAERLLELPIGHGDLTATGDGQDPHTSDEPGCTHFCVEWTVTDNMPLTQQTQDTDGTALGSPRTQTKSIDIVVFDRMSDNSRKERVTLNIIKPRFLNFRYVSDDESS